MNYPSKEVTESVNSEERKKRNECRQCNCNDPMHDVNVQPPLLFSSVSHLLFVLFISFCFCYGEIEDDINSYFYKYTN